MKKRVRTSGAGHGPAIFSIRRPSDIVSVHSSLRVSVNSTHGGEISPGHVPIGTAGGERRGEGQVTQLVMTGQGEYESDGQSEEESSHSMEKSKEYAQVHTSPGP
eukprot:5379031-Pyramimonas_sp.AAC.1